MLEEIVYDRVRAYYHAAATKQAGNLPNIFPGLESTPKKVWLSSASPSFINSDERPSRPSIGLMSEIWSPFARAPTVKHLSAVPVDNWISYSF